MLYFWEANSLQLSHTYRPPSPLGFWKRNIWKTKTDKTDPRSLMDGRDLMQVVENKLPVIKTLFSLSYHLFAMQTHRNTMVDLSHVNPPLVLCWVSCVLCHVPLQLHYSCIICLYLLRAPVCKLSGRTMQIRVDSWWFIHNSSCISQFITCRVLNLESCEVQQADSFRERTGWELVFLFCFTDIRVCPGQHLCPQF